MTYFPDNLNHNFLAYIIADKYDSDDVKEAAMLCRSLHDKATSNAQLLVERDEKIKRLESEIALLKANVLSLEEQVDDAYRQMNHF